MLNYAVVDSNVVAIFLDNLIAMHWSVISILMLFYNCRLMTSFVHFIALKSRVILMTNAGVFLCNC